MEPMKSAAPIANWMFRVSFLLYGILANWAVFNTFDITSKPFILGTLFMVLSILLFIGGFFKTNTMTVMSALGLVVLSVSTIIISDVELSKVLAVQLLLVSVAFYFLASGNNG